MKRVLFIFYFFFVLPNCMLAQALPKEGSVLDHRLVGFYFPDVVTPGKYELEIASGTLGTTELFEAHIIKKIPCYKNSIVAEVPNWGTAYTWRIVYTDSRSAIVKMPMHHFSTAYSPKIDSSDVRVRIIKPAQICKDAFFFLDGNKALYDMNGRAVWFLSDKMDANQSVSNLKLSPKGTMTFLLGFDAYEINWDGDILWHGTGGGLHHDFVRLNNGNYMGLGMGHELVKLSAANMAADAGMMPLAEQPFANLLEYDKTGKVVWSWESSKYYKTSDVVNFISKEKHVPDLMHENAFYFDEKDNVIYVGFKGINRILKLKYPEGTVLGTYGELYKPGEVPKGNSVFCGQHAMTLSRDKYLYLFNNNNCSPDEISKVIELREPAKGDSKLEKVWEYACTPESGTPAKYHRGGNVTELKDKSLFVCTGASVFIVNKEKQILFSALPEKWNASEKKWEPNPEYRANIIEDRKDIENLVWGGQIPAEHEKPLFAQNTGRENGNSFLRMAPALAEHPKHRTDDATAYQFYRHVSLDGTTAQQVFGRKKKRSSPSNLSTSL